ncbi:MAG: response regulator transcription factor [Verrucomicrobiaceae bacterium]|nr:response regulator transcription factor [Verrucomicrobiaceae bacterium]
MIVDDHETVRRGLKEIFADAFPKMEAGEATHSREALELILTQDWDIILLDISIPGQGGLMVLEEMKRLRPSIPVLVLSAYSEEEFAIRSLKLGASGFLNKSQTSDVLVEAAKKVMSGGKYVSSSLAEKLAFNLGGSAVRAPHEALSIRELQVLQMIAQGKAIKEIAAELGLSEKTVSTYRSRIATKMDLSTNVALTRYALKHLLVD